MSILSKRFTEYNAKIRADKKAKEMGTVVAVNKTGKTYVDRKIEDVEEQIAESIKDIRKDLERAKASLTSAELHASAEPRTIRVSDEDTRRAQLSNKRVRMYGIIAKERMEELEEVAKPVIEFLNKHYDPMCYVLITEGHVQVLRSEIGVPLKVRD